MDVEILSRLQFAFTIAFHYIYPPLSIGIAVILVIMEGMYLKTKDKFFENMTKFWVKVFALTFAIGVASGIVMEFEFGTNWATYSRFVGDVFGSAHGNRSQINNVVPVIERNKQQQVIADMTGDEEIFLNMLPAVPAELFRIVKLVEQLL